MMLPTPPKHLDLAPINSNTIITIRHCHPLFRAYFNVEGVQLDNLLVTHRFSYFVDAWTQHDILASTLEVHNGALVYFGNDQVTHCRPDDAFVQIVSERVNTF